MADELELIEGLVKDFEGYKAKSKKQMDDAVSEVKSLLEKSNGEAKAEYEKQLTELSAKVAQVNTEISEKGATIKQMMDEIAEFKAKRGRIFTGVDGEDLTINLLKDLFGQKESELKTMAIDNGISGKWKIKAVGTMTASAHLTGNVVAGYSSTPALRGRQKVHFRDLVDAVPSATGLWKFYRQNTPVGEGSFDTQSTHGAVKSQLDYDFTEVTTTVDYLAGFVRIAKQMLQDLPFMQSFVSGELVEDYLRAEDLKFWGQLYSAATGSTAGITATVTIEKIIQAIANLGEADFDANGIVVTNAVWAKILNTKPSDYSLPAGNAVNVNGAGEVSVLGIPLIRTKASYIGNDRVIVGDFSRTKIIQTEGLSVNVYEQDSDNVQRNLVTIKAEARVAQAILRPDAFIYFGAGTT